jgi:hypothetical protein
VSTSSEERWTPPIPPPDEVAAAFPRDVFSGASRALEDVFWLDLAEERLDVLLQRAGEVEEQLSELVLVWHRLGDDRIRQIEAMRGLYDAPQPPSGQVVDSEKYPEYASAWAREQDANTAVLLDYKSLFLFGDILVGDYVAMSEPVWEAPPELEHGDGLSAFLRSVATAGGNGELPAPFSEYMDVLQPLLVAVDDRVGFYRDRFITHVPPEMLTAGGGGSVGAPLGFHISHAPRREASEAELRRLRRTVRQVEQREGLDLGSDEPDPRPKLQKLGKSLDQLTHAENVTTVKNLLKQWGITSPAAIEVARGLNELFETWANELVRRVGLVSAADSVPPASS